MANVEQEIVAFFESKGLTRAQAAGIAGNAKQESSYNPSESGGGLFQDIGSRAASGTGGVQHQLEAAWGELQGRPSTLNTLKATRTPEEAARVFSKYFEEPGIPMLSNREKYAREAYNNSGKLKPEGILEGVPVLGGIEKRAEEAAIGINEAGESVLGKAANPFEALKSTASFIEALTSPSTWLRLAEGIGGIILFMVGLKTLTRGTTGATVVTQQSRSVKGIGVKTGRLITGVAK